jgi:hypothetical protein
MKNIFFFCLCSLLLSQLWAQPFEKKQITNFNYDSRGASFPLYGDGISHFVTSPIFFEAHKDNSINIVMMSYNSEEDSFYSLTNITDNNFININPIADASTDWSSSINLIWQTNENSNWDIALRILKDSVWSYKELIINSPANEINPKFVLRNYWSLQENYQIEIVYEEESGICLYQKRDSSVNNEIIFKNNDTLSYSQPTATYFSGQPNTPDGLYLAATAKSSDSTSIIVFRFKTPNDSVWSPIHTLYDSGYCENPKFCNPFFYYPFLSFERTSLNKKEIYIIQELDYFGQIPIAVPLVDYENKCTSDFSSFIYGVVGKLSKYKDYYFFGPHSYKIISNDSVYIARPWSYWNRNEEFFTKVSDTRIGVGNLGWEYWGHISYIIWEDSSNGYINLFGVKRLDQIGDVNDKIIVQNFILYQNYPNPFNPKTMIKYELLSRDFVALKVYDVLGNEVATLCNEEMDAGEYKTTFDGLNLASGIYVYRLSVGNNYLSRKMILLK